MDGAGGRPWLMELLDHFPMDARPDGPVSPTQQRGRVFSFLLRHALFLIRAS